MDVETYCTLVPGDLGCDKYNGGGGGNGGSSCCQLPVASCEACNARISEHEYCELYPSTNGCGHNSGETEECCETENSYRCQACKLNMGEIDYCEYVGSKSDNYEIREDCEKVIAAGKTGGGNYGECVVKNTRTGQCMDGATYLNAAKLGLMIATANYLI